MRTFSRPSAMVGRYCSPPISAHADAQFTWGAAAEEHTFGTNKYLHAEPPFARVIRTPGMTDTSGGSPNLGP